MKERPIRPNWEKNGQKRQFWKTKKMGQESSKSVQLELKVLEVITLKNFVTSRLNIYYNFKTFLAVCCPQLCPRKCTKSAKTAKSAKSAKTHKNTQKFFNAWDRRFWYQPKPRHHIEKFFWLTVWIYIIISRLSWLFVVPSGARGSVQSGQERANRPKRTKTGKNGQKWAKIFQCMR